MLASVIFLFCDLVHGEIKLTELRFFLLKTDFICRGSEDLKLKNQKRVERLIEEIHAMKVIPCLSISILEVIDFSSKKLCLFSGTALLKLN